MTTLPARPVSQIREIARKAQAPHGATLVSLDDIRRLATGYLDLVEALEAVALTDRSAPYSPGEACPGGIRPEKDTDRLQTPREIARCFIGGEDAEPAKA